MNNDRSVFRKEKILKVEVMAGANISSAITEAINLSKSNGLTVSFEFNEIELEVDQNSTLESVYKTWNDKMEKARIEYEKSPEYAAMQQRTEMNRQNAQRNLDQLASAMDTVDFSNLEQAIPYLSKVINNGDIMGVHFDRAKLDLKLQASGYFKNMNVGQIDPNDKDAVGKWLVGQYMSCGHPAIASHMDKWQEQFIIKEQEQGKTM